MKYLAPACWLIGVVMFVVGCSMISTGLGVAAGGVVLVAIAYGATE